eukprot:13174561-Alexandrium_andersonii.AAC.1
MANCAFNKELLTGRKVNFKSEAIPTSQTGPSPKAAPKSFAPEAPSSSTSPAPKATSPTSPPKAKAK